MGIYFAPKANRIGNSCAGLGVPNDGHLCRPLLREGGGEVG